MTAAQEAVRRTALNSKSRYPSDLAVQTMIVRAARTPEERSFAIRCVLEARAEWLNWLTRTQREWQTKVSRRPLRQRHHDSLAAREKYLRCAVAR